MLSANVKMYTMFCSMSDETVPEELRGKYQAFTLQDSAGVAHLRRLQSAGLTHIHLLPSYDYGSVPERAEDQATIKVTSQKSMLMKYKSIQCPHKVLLQVINWKYVISEMPGWFCCKHAMARLHTWLCWQLITLLVTHSISIHWGIHWLLDMTHAVP